MEKVDWDVILDDYLKYFEKKVSKGQCSPLDRFEILAITMFVDWLKHKQKKPVFVLVKR